MILSVVLRNTLTVIGVLVINMSLFDFAEPKSACLRNTGPWLGLLFSGHLSPNGLHEPFIT